MSKKEQGQSDEAIMTELKLSPWEYQAINGVYSITSTDQPLKENDPTTVGMMIPVAANLDEGLVEELYFNALDELLDRMRESHPLWCDVFEDFVCSSVYDEKPVQTALGAKYGMSQVQVSRILTRMSRLYRDQLERNGII